MSPLHIPEIAADADALSAAFAYAEAGWYAVPVRRGTKNPGSVVGDGWQHQSSRDRQQLAAWWPGTNHGVALHCGRSGAVAFDVDHPEAMPAVLAEAICEHNPPFQSTRAGQKGRGHYVFAMPAGRMLGNGVGKLGYGWGEVRGGNGVIVVQPSAHPAEGGCYRWQHTGPVPILPAAVAALLPDAGRGEDAATDAQVAAFLAEHTASERPELLDAVLARFRDRVAGGASRHDSAVACGCWAMAEAQAGYYPARRAAEAVGALLAKSLAGAPKRYPTSEWANILAWAVGQARTEDPAVRRRAVEQRVPLVSVLLQDFLAQVRTWQHLPDSVPVLAALAVAVTAEDEEGEPAWLLLVHVPSSGKTEIVRMLDAATKAHLDEVTVAGLLSWTRGKVPRPTGVLTRVEGGLVTFGDLSTLIASSEKTGTRDEIFALLRRVYDGHVTRNVGAPSGSGSHAALSWQGRLSIVGAVTGAIDSYATHAAALGARWLYCRLPDRTTEQKREAAKLARHGGLADNRAAARTLADRVVHAGRQRLAQVMLPDALSQVIEDAALVCCWGRAAVPRHGYGTREIDGPAVVEEPPRLIRQLTTMARGLLALDLAPDYVAAICRRLALDSMPAVRRGVLAALAAAEAKTATTVVAAAAGLDRGVARRALEELEVVGVVHADRQGAEPQDGWPDRRICLWSLLDPDGSLIREVINAARKDHKEEVFRNCATNPPSPPPKGDRVTSRERNIGTPPATAAPTEPNPPTQCDTCERVVSTKIDKAGARRCARCAPHLWPAVA